MISTWGREDRFRCCYYCELNYFLSRSQSPVSIHAPFSTEGTGENKLLQHVEKNDIAIDIKNVVCPSLASIEMLEMLESEQKKELVFFS